MIIRKATAEDIPAIDRIYQRIHDQEEAGLCTIGWERDVYPTEETACASVKRNDMYVLEEDGQIVAAAMINQEQVPVYYEVDWTLPAQDNEVLVIHTLVVDPECSRRGYGKRFVKYYCRLAEERGCKTLRLDTNERNETARAMYRSLGFAETAIVPCVFNGIQGVNLVCLEKPV